mmetsp:Transcript_15614/g.26164  ORF Transcript_15614/g.26164 Transcript_15614/m.26164 type:complete len:198 (-) Transcript_15614:114-707(-)
MQKETDPLIHQPSAPPMNPLNVGVPIVPSRNVVVPLEIAVSDTTSDVYPVAETTAAVSNRNRVTPMMQDARQESNTLDQKIAKGVYDGVALTQQDGIAKKMSNIEGRNEKAKVDRKINASNLDQGVHEMGAPQPCFERFTNEENPIADYTFTTQVAKKEGGTIAEPPQKGYQFSDYKSVYDEGGETYKPQDYKSIYD